MEQHTCRRCDEGCALFFIYFTCTGRGTRTDSSPAPVPSRIGPALFQSATQEPATWLDNMEVVHQELLEVADGGPAEREQVEPMRCMGQGQEGVR